MSTERDELAEIIQDVGEYIPGSHADDYTCPTKAADAILAASYRPPARVITTAEELDALREGSAVLDDDHDVSTKHNGRWHGYETAPLDSRKLRVFGPFTILWEPTL